MNIDEKVFTALTDEQKKKVEAAQTPEQLLAIARETGYELSDDQLADLSGGGFWKTCNDNKHDSIIR